MKLCVSVVFFLLPLLLLLLVLLLHLAEFSMHCSCDVALRLHVLRRLKSKPSGHTTFVIGRTYNVCARARNMQN